MTHPKNARDPNQHHKNAATIAISIAATTFVGHPLIKITVREGLKCKRVWTPPLEVEKNKVIFF